MPVTSYLRARRRGRWSWHAGRVAVAGAALAAAAIAGSGGTPGGSAAHAVIATGATPAATMAQPSGQAPSATTSAAASAAATAPSRAPRRVVHTMSMDAPIQGGLTAHQEQALSARLVAAHRDAPLAGRSGYWTPAMAHTAVARARSWLGMPYSWAGGDATGPTTGRCDVHNGGDLDCHVVGFDCSGLAMYAWGPYASLPHLASAQRQAGAFHPTLAQLRPGDLVFFSAYLPGGTGHVAIYTGHGRVIEAPQSGSVIRRSTLSALMADDGTYRGAVRPLTGATPTLGTPQHTVSTLGGVVTLHGANLAQVSAVHLGGATVRSFYTHTDTTIAFPAPAHRHGAVAVTVSTSWHARSQPVTVTYVAPRPSRRITLDPSTPPTTSAPPSSSAPPMTIGGASSSAPSASGH